jgi:hypothetical protein
MYTMIHAIIATKDASFMLKEKRDHEKRYDQKRNR